MAAAPDRTRTGDDDDLVGSGRGRATALAGVVARVEEAEQVLLAETLEHPPRRCALSRRPSRPRRPARDRCCCAAASRPRVCRSRAAHEPGTRRRKLTERGRPGPDVDDDGVVLTHGHERGPGGHGHGGAADAALPGHERDGARGRPAAADRVHQVALLLRRDRRIRRSPVPCRPRGTAVRSPAGTRLVGVAGQELLDPAHRLASCPRRPPHSGESAVAPEQRVAPRGSRRCAAPRRRHRGPQLDHGRARGPGVGRLGPGSCDRVRRAPWRRGCPPARGCGDRCPCGQGRRGRLRTAQLALRHPVWARRSSGG